MFLLVGGKKNVSLYATNICPARFLSHLLKQTLKTGFAQSLAVLTFAQGVVP